MLSEQKKRNKRRIKRAYRVRRQVKGTAERPRLSIFRSNKHLQVQLIDDENHTTLVGLSTMQKSSQESDAKRRDKTSAKALGELLAKKAKEKSITKIKFDRGFYKFHGVVAELASAAREQGLQF